MQIMFLPSWKADLGPVAETEVGTAGNGREGASFLIARLGLEFDAELAAFSCLETFNFEVGAVDGPASGCDTSTDFVSGFCWMVEAPASKRAFFV
jgi:hypothetical protein